MLRQDFGVADPRTAVKRTAKRTEEIDLRQVKFTDHMTHCIRIFLNKTAFSCVVRLNLGLLENFNLQSCSNVTYLRNYSF